MAGSLTQTVSQSRNNTLKVWTAKLVVTGDSSNGTLAATPLSDDLMSKIGGSYLFAIKTIAGSTPPNAWSFTLTDSYGYDILGGVGASRNVSSTVPQKSVPKQDSSTAVYGPAYVPGELGGLTMNLSGNSTASATGTILLFCSAP